MDSDNIVIRPWEEMAKIEHFLGIPKEYGIPDAFYLNRTKGFYCLKVFGCLYSRKGMDHPDISSQFENKLRKFFDPWNKRLYELVGFDFRWPTAD